MKIDDYWEVGKAQLQDPTKFLDSLFKYDKVFLYLIMPSILLSIIISSLITMFTVRLKMFSKPRIDDVELFTIRIIDF